MNTSWLFLYLLFFYGFFYYVLVKVETYTYFFFFHYVHHTCLYMKQFSYYMACNYWTVLHIYYYISFIEAVP